MTDYFQHIHKLNNLQLCHFLRMCHANLDLVAFALERAENPEIYASDDNWAIGTPKKDREFYTDTVYWHRCLSKDYDDMMAELRKPEYSAYVNPLYEWQENADPGQPVGSTWECPYCHMNYHEQAPWNPREAKWRYCPNCGKRMGREDDDSGMA